MNRLANMRAYLGGAMDRVSDGGVGWRRQIQEELSDLGIIFMDPTNKPIDIGVENQETRARRHFEKEMGNYQYVVDEMKPIRCVDLRMCDIADFLIVFLDKDNSGFGTIEEMVLANREKKPILVMQEGGKRLCPDWAFGMIPHQHIFGNWSDLTDYIHHMAHDPVVDTMNRWMFFDFHGENMEDYALCQ